MQSANSNARNHASIPPYTSGQISNDQTASSSYGAVADAAFTEMMKRFKATKATENASFILTKVDGGVALVKVDKDTGATLDEIVIKDKDPMYEVDDVEGILYFKSKGNTIQAFKLNK